MKLTRGLMAIIIDVIGIIATIYLWVNFFPYKIWPLILLLILFVIIFLILYLEDTRGALGWNFTDEDRMSDEDILYRNRGN